MLRRYYAEFAMPAAPFHQQPRDAAAAAARTTRVRRHGKDERRQPRVDYVFRHAHIKPACRDMLSAMRK